MDLAQRIEAYAEGMSAQARGDSDAVDHAVVRMLDQAERITEEAAERRLGYAQYAHQWARETDIADLANADAFVSAGLDPTIAFAAHPRAQALADELRRAGYRGLLSPSAALAEGVCLTLFGERLDVEAARHDLQEADPPPRGWIEYTIAADEALVPPTVMRELEVDGWNLSAPGGVVRYEFRPSPSEGP